MLLKILSCSSLHLGFCFPSHRPMFTIYFTIESIDARRCTCSSSKRIFSGSPKKTGAPSADVSSSDSVLCRSPIWGWSNIPKWPILLHISENDSYIYIWYIYIYISYMYIYIYMIYMIVGDFMTYLWKYAYVQPSSPRHSGHHFGGTSRGSGHGMASLGSNLFMIQWVDD